MPVLPLIDLMILMGWTCITLGGVLKAIAVSTRYRPELFSLGPHEFLLIAGIFLLFALALAARTWVKAYEPEMLATRRRVSSLHSVAGESAEFGSENSANGTKGPSSAQPPFKRTSV